MEKRLALAVYQKGSPDAAVVQGFLDALAEIDDRIPSLALIGERGSQDRTAHARANAIVACGADLRCIARVGLAVKATHVLFGRASEQSGCVTMQWLLVEVSSATVTGKFRTSPPDAAAARAEAAKMVAEVLGAKEYDRVAKEETRREPSRPAAVRAPGTVQSPRQESHPPAPPGPPPGELGWTSPRAVATLAAVASGAVFLTVGLYLGQQARAPDGGARGIGAGPGVARLVADGPRLGANRAGAMLAVGGLLAAGGCALWVRDSMTVSPAVAVGADGGVAGVSVAW